MAVLARPSDQHLFLLPSFQQLAIMVVAVVVLLLGSSGPSPAAASQAVLQRICKNAAELEGTCLRILLPQPWAISCGDEKCIVGNMIPRMAQPQAKAAFDLVQKLIDDRSRGDLEEALSKCNQAYGEVLNKLDDALEAFNGGSYSEAMDDAGVAEDDVVACENGFERKPSPMSDANRRVHDSVSVIATILDVLVG